MGGSGGGSTNTVQKADPWIGAQPYIRNSLSAADAQFNSGSGSEFFPGDTLAPRSPETVGALGQLTNNAYSGNTAASAAYGDSTKTLEGQYLDPSTNPHLRGIYDRTAGDIRNQVGSVFAKGGRYGGAYHQDTLQRGLTDAANTIYGSQYQGERDNMMRAQALAPQSASLQNFSAGQLAGVGQANDARSQAEINAERERFEYGRDFPAASLSRYSQIVNGTSGLGGQSTSSSSTNNGGAGIGGILGGGLAGASAGSSLATALGFATPWGAGIGAGIGILGSLFN